MRSGVLVSDEGAVVTALCAAALEIYKLLQAQAETLVVPTSARAARSANAILKALSAREDAGTMQLRTSCTAASMAASASMGGGSRTNSNTRNSFSLSRGHTLPAPATPAVALADLERFLFPPGEQHSRSVGRLVAFALFGPLRAGQLWSGRGGTRALTRPELNAEIDAIERHDALRAYTGDSVLGDIDAVLRVARADGRYEFPRMSLPQVRAMLRDIPRDAVGDADFHDIQLLVFGARAKRVHDLGLLFPPKPTGEEARVSFMPRAPLLGHNALSAGAEAAAAMAQLRSRIGPPMAHASDVWKKVSDIDRRRHHDGLLNAKSQSIAPIADANSAGMIPALHSNILLLRHDVPGHYVGGAWNNDVHSKGRGSFVPGSISRNVGLHNIKMT